MGIDRDQFFVEEVSDEALENAGWQIMRTPTKKPLLMVCMSTKILLIRTHYYQGRTQPCRKDGCEACSRKLLARRHGYIVALRHTDQAKLVFEFTEQAAVSLKSQTQELKTLRGLQIIASRAKDAENGKVVLTARGVSQDPLLWITEDDPWPMLSRIWGLDKEVPANFPEFNQFGMSEDEKVRAALPKQSKVNDLETDAERAALIRAALPALPDCIRKVNGGQGAGRVTV